MSEAVKKLRRFTQEHAWKVYRDDMDMRADVEEVLAELDRLKAEIEEVTEENTRLLHQLYARDVADRADDARLDGRR